jgi:hypothetical protein
MKDSEEAIEKLLAGLRNCDPPAGMEHRILETIQNQALANSRSGWRLQTPGWLEFQKSAVLTGSLIGCVSLGIFAFVLTISVIRRPEHAPAQSERSSVPLVSPPAARSEAVEESEQLAALVTRSESRKAKVRRTGGNSAQDLLALREMRAPSRPEPPMPLTEQEKLLVSYVQTLSPEELAAIDPVKWAAQDAKEKAEFEKFFGQSANRGSE